MSEAPGWVAMASLVIVLWGLFGGWFFPALLIGAAIVAAGAAALAVSAQ